MLKELEWKAEDPLGKWAKAQSGFIKPHTQPVQDAVRQIVNAHKIVNPNIGKSKGDPWVIALAQCGGLTVITEEKSSPAATYRKIPDVCSAMGIRCINILGLIRAERWTF